MHYRRTDFEGEIQPGPEGGDDPSRGRSRRCWSAGLQPKAAMPARRHVRRPRRRAKCGNDRHPGGLDKALSFPLIEALHGRRARRFSLGAEIPDGVLAYRSTHEPMPRTDLEKKMLGRTFSSAAGFHVSEVFYTDDDGVYLFETRDAPKLVDRGAGDPLDIEPSSMRTVGVFANSRTGV